MEWYDDDHDPDEKWLPDFDDDTDDVADNDEALEHEADNDLEGLFDA